MKAVVAAFNQEKDLVGAFSVIVQPVVEPMEHYTALIVTHLPASTSPSLYSTWGMWRVNFLALDWDLLEL